MTKPETKDAAACWGGIREVLRAGLGAESFDTWFKDLQFRGLEKATLFLTAPNGYVRRWLNAHFQDELLSAATAVVPEVRRVELTVGSNGYGKSDGKNGRTIATVKELLPAALAVKRGNDGDDGRAHGSRRSDAARGRVSLRGFAPHRLETFTVGTADRVAYAACRSVSEVPGERYNPLLLVGGHGVGKTHLLRGVARELEARRRKAAVGSDEARPVLCLTGEEFTNAFITASRERNLDAFRARFRNCGALLLDDVHFLAGREKTQQEFLHTFDALLREGRQIVLTSAEPPHRVKRLDPGLASRLPAGLTVTVGGPDVAARRQLLRQKALARGLRLTDEAIELLAVRPTENVRELEGVVCKLAALSAAEGRPADAELARRALRELGCLRPGPPSLDEILQSTAKALRVEPDQLRSARRQSRIVRARQTAMYLARRTTDYGTSEIGRFFGHRNHATVVHAVKKITALLEKDEELRELVSGLERLFAH